MKCVTKVTITWEAEEDVPENKELQTIAKLANEKSYAEMKQELISAIIDSINLKDDKVRKYNVDADAYLE